MLFYTVLGYHLIDLNIIWQVQIKMKYHIETPLISIQKIAFEAVKAYLIPSRLKHYIACGTIVHRFKSADS